MFKNKLPYVSNILLHPTYNLFFKKNKKSHCITFLDAAHLGGIYLVISLSQNTIGSS